jgi:hypothetical protein
MSQQGLTPEKIERAQDLVSRIRGVSSCQITTDEAGRITEVHVVALAGKPAKLIARDVETCLKAEMGVDLDYKKIGVVIFDRDDDPPLHDDPPSPASPAVEFEEFDVQEFASRFLFQGINVFKRPDGVRVEVSMIRDSEESVGISEVARSSTSLRRAVAEATLAAVSDLLDESARLCLGEVRKVSLGTSQAVVVTAELVAGRDVSTLLGSAMIGDDDNDAIVCATLDAVNRVLGRLNQKSSVEYRIR